MTTLKTTLATNRSESLSRFIVTLSVAAALVSNFVLPSDAQAFKIVSALTDGCHENITMGSLGKSSPAFNGDGTPSTASLLARFVQRVTTEGIPQDEASRGLRRENANRYGWGGYTEAEQYILASFLAGVRAPDTGGYSIVDFSQIRGSHIRDDEQSAHFLRRKDSDGTQGDIAVIQETTTRLATLANAALTQWATGGTAETRVRWTFAFYGERDVSVFGPAYNLGLIAHAVQDSYAHALRDENDLRVIAIANYLEVILDGFSDDRDGPGHSERLDQCNVNDSFDAPRINEARRQTARVFEVLDQQMASNGVDTSAFSAALAAVFDYKPGCNGANRYCNGLWYQKSLEDVSKPYEVGCGLARPASHHDHHHGSGGGGKMTTSLSVNAMVFFLLIGLPILTALGLRRRSRS